MNIPSIYNTGGASSGSHKILRNLPKRFFSHRILIEDLFVLLSQPVQDIKIFRFLIFRYYFHDDRKWTPFSHFDSGRIEALFRTNGGSKVSSDGGRFDVDLNTWRRSAVYWNEAPCEVRR